MIDEELKGLLGEMRQEAVGIRDEITEMRRENAAAHAETRHELSGKIDVASEATQDRLKLVAEIVGLVDEKIDVTAATLDQKIELTAAATQALIHSSYGALDRRVQKLEAAQHTVE